MSSHSLEIRDLTVSYQRVPAIHHLNLELKCGHCVALLGPNGAGKTTLLKSIAGLLPIPVDSVRFHGHSGRRIASELAYLPQRENVDWDFPITVRGVVEMGCYMRLGWWRGFGSRDRQVVDGALASMHLTDLADRQISALSGGQQQRVFLARSLAQEAHVFLFDEPFTGLDRPAQAGLGQTLRALAAAGNLIIASHHDLKSVPDLFHQVIFLNGELIAFGNTAEVFSEANIVRTFQTDVFSGVRI